MAQEILIVEVPPREKRSIVNRRKSPRIECSETTRYVCATTGQALWARVKNVSKSGMGLVVSQPIAVGKLLSVTPWRAASSLQAQVVHCTRIGEGSWLIGCSFIASLGNKELETVLRTWR